MKRFRFKKIDAFVEGDSAGNPAGCVYLADPDTISEEGMQQIARELGGFVSEVAFVFPDEGHTGLRFFSPECEVAFCGHCTIAVMYDLLKNDAAAARDPITRIRVHGREVLVRNEIASSDSVFVGSPLPKFLPTRLAADDVAAVLKIPPGEIAEKERIRLINAGLNTLVVPILSREAILSLRPDQKHMREFCQANDIEIVLAFSRPPTSADSYRTRVFAPVFGYLEDPATGSGNAALGYYLLDSTEWDGHEIRIEQGRNRLHPNIVRLMSDASRIQRTVYFGGRAKVRIEGDYLLY